MRPVRRYAALLLLATIVLLGVSTALPSDPYVRFRQLDEGDHLKLRWIYERLHFDPTPIDVAFIGTSRTLNGVDSVLTEQAMHDAGDRRAHVVNFAVPTPGDDLHDLIVRMLLRAHRPRVLVIEATEVEGRASHPAFARVADVGDILSAPLNSPDALDAIVRLPSRQLTLFEDTARDWLDGDTAFDPARYPGPHWDDTVRVTFRHHSYGPERTAAMPVDKLLAGAAEVRRSEAGRAAQWDRYRWLMFAYNQHFVRDMLNAAREDGVRIVFLYLPAFGGAAAPAEAALFAQYGEIWTPPADLLADPRLWNDPEHLNYPGAQRLSAWLGARLADTQPQAAALR